jgi:hypothetical protein
MYSKLGKALSRVTLLPRDIKTLSLKSPPSRTASLAGLSGGKFWDSSGNLHNEDTISMVISLSPEMDLFFTDPNASVSKMDEMKRRAEWKLKPVGKEGKMMRPVGSKTEVSTVYWEAR